MAAMELTYAGTLFYQNSQVTNVIIGERLFVDFLYKKIIYTGKYLLKLFENFVGVRFLEPQCSA